MPKSMVALLAIAIGAGCIQAKYEDVSDLPAYGDLIAKQFKTQVALQVLGITGDRNYRPVVDYYLLVGTPGIAGPEVVERSPLPAGSLVEVVEVSRCTNCAYLAIRIGVRIIRKDAYDEKAVFIDDRGDLVETGADGRSTTLNPDRFKLISK